MVSQKHNHLILHGFLGVIGGLVVPRRGNLLFHIIMQEWRLPISPVKQNGPKNGPDLYTLRRESSYHQVA